MMAYQGLVHQECLNLRSTWNILESTLHFSSKNPGLRAGPSWGPSFPAEDLQAKEVGQQVTTPHGVVYEPLELGTEEQGPRSGPPRGGSTVILKYTARLDGWNGPIFDSSTLRGQRKPNKVDFIESRLNVDPSLPNCVWPEYNSPFERFVFFRSILTLFIAHVAM